MHRIAEMPNIQQRIANSIAPSIFGSTDIKKAIACLLFSGSRKHLPDGTRLRGDINVLLLGDPGACCVAACCVFCRCTVLAAAVLY